MRAVNLLPADATQRRSFSGRGLVAVGSAVLGAILVAVLGFVYLSASSTASDRQATLDGLHAQLAAVPAGLKPVSAADLQLAGDRSTRIQALNAALSGRVAWDRVLRQVSLVLPSDVWLTDLTGTAPVVAPPVASSTTSTDQSTPATTTSTPTPAPAPSPTSASSGFSLTGFTYSQDSVARLLTRLAAVPSLSNVRLESSAAQVIAKQRVYQFIVNADLKGGGA